jgi:SAM-dependent methyltransferase
VHPAESGARPAVLGTLRRWAKRSRILGTVYRSSRAALVGLKAPQRVWSEGLPEEVDFWEKALPGRVARLEDYKLRVDRQAPMRDPVVRMLIGRIPEDAISIIDVGAGPLTALGKTYPGKTLRITATDPLADEYARINAEAGIEPPVPTIACRGEDLLDRFQRGTYDIAFALNALDHCYDPVRVITNMVELVKEERFVVLKHNRSEARHQFYRGLHQWNFDIEEGEFIIRRPRHGTVYLNQVLADTATVGCFVDEDDWLVCLITKRSLPRSGASRTEVK